eukprot:CAMPEP_0182437826 /NCGR_PEP_ID=MMETSP1167-20130531/85304_1 /TAXON_ID=2988 /ORGANISM="Mallomonas Sp, Strain CCMP3275" /LENGTH=1356 /DNA_ID=CAMNT_0024630879 /DNA_START=211 /DNA_END=4282 /DNA_ORIENTATION=+
MAQYPHILRSKDIILPPQRPQRELGEVIEFELLDGEIAFGSVTRVVDRGVKGVTWSGKLAFANDRTDMSAFEDRFSLTCVKSACVGRLVVESTGTQYEIRPGVGRVLSTDGEGIYRLSQIDLKRDFKSMDPLAEEIDDKLQKMADQQAMNTDTDLIIDIGVMYTNQARSYLGYSDAAMIAAIHNVNDETNDLCGRSGVVIRYRIVFVVPTADAGYTEPANTVAGWDLLLDRFRYTSDGHLDEVHAYRNQYGADFLLLVNAARVFCGSAYVLNNFSPSYAVSNYAAMCLDVTTWAHELGHQQGCYHDRISDSDRISSLPSNFKGFGHCWDDSSFSSCRCYSSVLVYDCNTPKGCTSCYDRDYYSNVNIINAGNPTGANLASCGLHINEQRLRPISYRDSVQEGGMIFSVTPTSAILRECRIVVISGFMIAPAGSSITSVTIAGVEAPILSHNYHIVRVITPPVRSATTEPGAVVVTTNTGRVTTMYGVFSFVTGSADGSTCTTTMKDLPDEYTPVFESLPSKSFSGVNSGYLRDSILHSIGTQLTISMWITTTTTGGYLVSLGRSPVMNTNLFHFHITSNGRLNFYDYGGGSEGFSSSSGYSSSIVTSGARTHVAFVKDGTVGRYYVNGVLSGSKTGSKSVTYNNEDLSVGYAYLRSHSNFYNGDIEKLRIHRKALTGSQISSLYSSDSFSNEDSVAPTVSPSPKPTTLLPTVTPTISFQPTAPTVMPTIGAIFHIDEPSAFTGSTGLFYETISATLHHRVTNASTIIGAIFHIDEPSAFTGSTGLFYETISATLYHRVTISMVIEPSETGSSLMSIGVSPSGFDAYFYLLLNGNGKLRVLDYMVGRGWGFDRTYQSNDAVSVGVKTHVGFVKQGLSGTFYVNGVASGTMQSSHSNVYGDKYLGIGYNPRNGGLRFVGEMSSVKLYDQSLSDEEMMALYASSVTSNIPTTAPTPIPTSTFQPTTPTALPTSAMPTPQPTIRGIFELNEMTVFTGSTGLFYDTIPTSLQHRISISMIIKPTKGGVSLMSIGISPTEADGYLFFFLNGNGKLKMLDYMKGRGWGFEPTDQSTTVIPMGVRSHVGFIKQGLSGTYYINGEVAGTIRASSSNAYGDRNLGLGYNPRNGGNVFVGEMSHVKLFDTLVSAEFMMEQYLSGTSYPTVLPTLEPTRPTAQPTTVPTVSPGHVPDDPVFAFDGMAYFDGVNSMMLLDELPRPVSILSISMWIKTSVVSTDLIHMRASGFNEFCLEISSSGKLRFFDWRDYTDGYSLFESSNAVVTTGTRTHVGVVKNGLSLTLYVNGVPSGTATASFLVDYPNKEFAIGFDSWMDTSYFNGEMDHIKVYDIALSSSEMSTIYTMES